VDATTIVYPAIAMFFLTLSLIVRLGVQRVGAVRSGQISVAYYRLYNEGVQPDHLQQIGRHVQNHFEVPPLFYVVLLFLYVTGSVTALAVALAWLYVALRVVHSAVHLGRNDVRQRLIVWMSSVAALAALWVLLGVSLLSRA